MDRVLLLTLDFDALLADGKRLLAILFRGLRIRRDDFVAAPVLIIYLLTQFNFVIRDVFAQSTLSLDFGPPITWEVVFLPIYLCRRKAYSGNSSGSYSGCNTGTRGRKSENTGCDIRYLYSWRAAVTSVVIPTMDPNTKYILIATVVVAAIILVALLSRHLTKHDAYTVLSPATPLLQDAMGRVLDDINLISSYGREFLNAKTAGAVSTPEGVAVKMSKDSSAATVVDTARIPVQNLTVALENSASRIKRSVPSWDNYAQIYRALGGSDSSMLKSAQSYIDAGRAAQQFIAQNPGDADTLYYTIAGSALIGLGRQIRSLTVSIHDLGVSLDLE